MTIDEIKVMIELSKTLHFGKTSRATHMSAPSVTRLVQRLEDELGCRLFDRDNRRVQLTEAGKVFQQYVEQQLRAWSELQVAISGVKGTVSGLVRIYCSVTASHSILTDILRPIKDRYPEIRVALSTGPSEETFQKISDDEVDIGICAYPKAVPSSIKIRKIKEVGLSVIVPKGASLDDIRSNALPFIYPKSALTRSYISDWFHQQGIAVKVYTELADVDGTMSLVSLGYGASVIPSLSCASHHLRDQVEVLPMTPELPSLKVGICCKKKVTYPSYVKVIMDAFPST
ncbi:MAG: HTH-type transcriptional activator IlvY [Actinobacteria bacterium]|nr:HTH-type transcriptional activator IlvY [Actinomycetota bacterium]